MQWFVTECIGPSHFIQIRYMPQGAFTAARTFMHYEDKIYLNIVLNMNSKLILRFVPLLQLCLNMYLFARQRQTQRDIFHPQVHSVRNSKWSQARARRRGLSVGLPHGWRPPNYSIHHLLPVVCAFAGSWNWKQKWDLNLCSLIRDKEQPKPHLYCCAKCHPYIVLFILLIKFCPF